MRTARPLGLLLGALLLLAPRARAMEEGARAPSAGVNDEEVSRRLRFIEQRLDGEVRGARLWTYGWMAFNTVGIGYSAWKAATARDQANRTDQWLGVSKAAIGIAGSFLQPLGALRGSSELRGLSESTPELRWKKLLTAERLLVRNAAQADQRYSLIPHGMNLALNVLSGVIVTAVGKQPSTAWISAAIGVAFGELTIWTQPRKAKLDLRDYRRNFGGTSYSSRGPGRDAAPDGLSLSLVPLSTVPLGRGISAGLALQLTF